MRIRHALALGLFVVVSTSCSDDMDPIDTDTSSSSSATVDSTATGTQMANPASEYCIAQGGRLEIVDEASGQVGYCNLPDGRRVEEWEFYRASNG